MDWLSFPIGAKAVINIDAETRGWGYNPFPQNTVVTVLGYTWTHYGRTGVGAHNPGFFTNLFWVKVTDGTKTVDVGTHILEGDKVRISQEKIADLPDSDFYEEDVVAFTRDHAWPKGTEVVVHYISYEDMETVAHYSVGPSNGGSTYANAKDLRLVSRGNVWKKYHGIPLVFHSLLDELNFAMSTRACDEMPNPRQDNIYAWTLAEAMDAIKAGEIDGFTDRRSSFTFIESDASRLSAYRFHDRDLAERARKHMLAEFTDEFVRSRSR